MQIDLTRLNFTSSGSLDQGEYRIIGLEKLLFLKALGLKVARYHADLELIVQKLLDSQYAPWWATLTDEQRARYQASQAG